MERVKNLAEVERLNPLHPLRIKDLVEMLHSSLMDARSILVEIGDVQEALCASADFRYYILSALRLANYLRRFDIVRFYLAGFGVNWELTCYYWVGMFPYLFRFKEKVSEDFSREWRADFKRFQSIAMRNVSNRNTPNEVRSGRQLLFHGVVK